MELDRQRIDKWLWHARIIKTRTLAQKLVVSGKVRLNKEKLNSSSRQVKIDDVLTISLDHCISVIRILKIASKRGPAVEARQLYESLSQTIISKNRTADSSIIRNPGAGRPTKKDRRQLNKLRGFSPN